MKKAGKTQEEIARAIGFSQSTVSKELKRNSGKKDYREKQAAQKAAKRKKDKRSRLPLVTENLKAEVDGRLKSKHSPEQISGALHLVEIRISHETIYSYIRADKTAEGNLYKELRINGNRRYRRRVKGGRVSKIGGRVGLEHRPGIVESRKCYGDWKVDLIEGSKGSGYLLILYERKSRLGKLVYLPDKGASGTAQAIITELSGYKVETLTYDNGLEFSRHAEISEAPQAQGYFCAPYHSWEKREVENFGSLRWSDSLDRFSDGFRSNGGYVSWEVFLGRGEFIVLWEGSCS